MRVLISVFVLVAGIACSSSPTAPSQSSGAAVALRWDVVSTSCAPVSAPSPQPDMSNATITTQADGSMLASWPYEQNGRTVMLYATFVRENGTWAMCSWDTADVMLQ